MATTKGTIYKGNAKGAYYVRYMVNGQRMKQALRDSDGLPIYEKGKARRATDRLLAPLRERDASERVKLMARAVEDAEAQADRLEAEAKASAEADAKAKLEARNRVENGWRIFMECPRRPASCRRFGASEAIPRNTTAANYLIYYNAFAGWCKAKGRVLLSEVTPADAEAFLKSLHVSGGTHNKYLQFLRCLYDTLVKAKRLEANPFADVEAAPATCHSKEPMSVEQVAMLLQAAWGDMRVLFALGYFTGLRLGDCCTLKWNEVDLVRGVIERLPRKTGGRAKDRALATVKVGMPVPLRRLLEALPERTGYVLPSLAEEYLAHMDRVADKVAAVFRAAGIETRAEGTGGGKGAPHAIVVHGFHSLRYSYISHNAEAGTPAAVIQRNAGHSNPAMTQHYTKISDAAAVRYAGALSLPGWGGDDGQAATERARLIQEVTSAAQGATSEALKAALAALRK